MDDDKAAYLQALIRDIDHLKATLRAAERDCADLTAKIQLKEAAHRILAATWRPDL